MADIILYEGNNELNVQLTPIPVPVANLYGLATYADSAGQYAFEGLTPGGYTITFEKEGYETVVR